MELQEMELRDRLAALRMERGMSQSDLARELGVTRQTVSRWEQGLMTPSTDRLIDVARVFHMSLDELVNGGPPVPEGVEAPPPADGEAPGKRGWKIAAGVVLAACLALVTVAAVITIWSAVFKGPEEPGDKIVWMDDITPEYIDPAEVQDWTDTTIIIEE